MRTRHWCFLWSSDFGEDGNRKEDKQFDAEQNAEQNAEQTANRCVGRITCEHLVSHERLGSAEVDPKRRT